MKESVAVKAVGELKHEEDCKSLRTSVQVMRTSTRFADKISRLKDEFGTPIPAVRCDEEGSVKCYLAVVSAQSQSSFSQWEPFTAATSAPVAEPAGADDEDEEEITLDVADFADGVGWFTYGEACQLVCGR